MATCVNVLGYKQADALVGFKGLQFADAFYAPTPGGGIRLTEYVTERNRHPVATALVGGGLVIALEHAYSSNFGHEIDRGAGNSPGHRAGASKSEDRGNTTTADDRHSPAIKALSGAAASSPGNPTFRIAAAGASISGASFRLRTHP